MKDQEPVETSGSGSDSEVDIPSPAESPGPPQAIPPRESLPAAIANMMAILSPACPQRVTRDDLERAAGGLATVADLRGALVAAWEDAAQLQLDATRATLSAYHNYHSYEFHRDESRGMLNTLADRLRREQAEHEATRRELARLRGEPEPVPVPDHYLAGYYTEDWKQLPLPLAWVAHLTGRKVFDRDGGCAFAVHAHAGPRPVIDPGLDKYASFTEPTTPAPGESPGAGVVIEMEALPAP